MAIMMQSLEFGGVVSSDYGIYIGGEGTFNAPKRAVELISVPGRNGAVAIDQGYWENIEVTYPCFVYEPDLQSFSQTLARFRNALKSQVGYQRLVDTINPDEYRMALFTDDFEVKPLNYNTLGRFDLTFNCKPQRFLMSGESEISMSNGDKIFNPTPFASRPLINIEGYGVINLGEQAISISDIPLGAVDISKSIKVLNQDLSRTWTIDTSVFETGDTITVSGLKLTSSLSITNNATFVTDGSVDPDNPMGISYYSSPDTDAALSYGISGKTVTFGMTVPTITLTIGQNSSKTYKTKATVKVQNSTNWERNNIYSTTKITFSNNVLTITAEELFDSGGYLDIANPTESSLIQLDSIRGYSTLSTLTDPLVIDCDIGEVYKIVSDEYYPMNSIASLGSDLPELVPGDTEITYDNTITSFKIVPRWWML